MTLEPLDTDYTPDELQNGLRMLLNSGYRLQVASQASGESVSDYRGLKLSKRAGFDPGTHEIRSKVIFYVEFGSSLIPVATMEGKETRRMVDVLDRGDRLMPKTEIRVRLHVDERAKAFKLPEVMRMLRQNPNL